MARGGTGGRSGLRHAELPSLSKSYFRPLGGGERLTASISLDSRESKRQAVYRSQDPRGLKLGNEEAESIF